METVFIIVIAFLFIYTTITANHSLETRRMVRRLDRCLSDHLRETTKLKTKDDMAWKEDDLFFGKEKNVIQGKD